MIIALTAKQKVDRGGVTARVESETKQGIPHPIRDFTKFKDHGLVNFCGENYYMSSYASVPEKNYNLEWDAG